MNQSKVQPFDPDTIKGVDPSELMLEAMLAKIDELVSGDFLEDISMTLASEPPRDFTQEEAREMARILGNVYTIAHCLHCRACQRRWVKSSRDNTESQTVRGNDGPAVHPTPNKGTRE